jgi:Na+-transporting NADH:ubiquinone oxidoreductase subunit NqrF
MSFGIFDESHYSKTSISVGWQLAIQARIQFNLQVRVTPGFL